MLVQFSPNGVDHRSPALNKTVQLLCLARVKLGNVRERGYLLLHQQKIAQRPPARAGHFGVSTQGVAAQNDAAISFGRCHAEILPWR